MQVLSEIKNKNEITKPKPKKRTPEVTQIANEESYVLTDDSIVDEDDTEKDPDWMRTPLYNRIKKLLVICLNQLSSNANLNYRRHTL